MSWHNRITNVFRRKRLQDEAGRELSFHIQERAEQLRAAGLSPEAADREARRQFGNLTSHIEATGDMDVAPWLDTTVRNLRISIRGLAKTPGFTLTVVLTLALGIGANSAVFSALDTVLLRPLPYPDGDQLVRMLEVSPEGAARSIAPVRLEDWNRMNDTFQAITGYNTEDVSEHSGDLPERLRRARFAPRFLDVFGVKPALGRGFTDEEWRAAASVVLLSDRYWRRRFSADPDVIGQTLLIGEEAPVIAGVMPASFQFPDAGVDLWSPLPTQGQPYSELRTLNWFVPVGRMKPGVNLAQARANMDAVQSALGRSYPDPDAELTVRMESLKDVAVGGVRHSMWLLFGAVTLLLLAACANIAAMLLSRATQRQAEVSIRYSLGASRGSILAQQIAEAFVLSLAGGALGLALAAVAARVFQTLAADLPRIQQMSVNGRLLLYTLACSIAVTFVCGLLPSMAATRRDLRRALSRAGRSQVSSGTFARWAMVGAQVALAVTLLSGAGLLSRSLQELGRASPGFDASRVLSMNISMAWAEALPGRDPVGDRVALGQWTTRMLDALESVPGVEAAAISGGMPGLVPESHIEFELVEGRAETAPSMIANTRSVSPSYFRTLRIPVLAGELCESDPTGSNPSDVVVNRRFAESYFNADDPIGYRLRPAAYPGSPPSRILGIVGDARENGLDRDPAPIVYGCTGIAYPGQTFLVRTSGPPASMGETLRRKIEEVEPGRALYAITPLAEHLTGARAEDRLRAILFSFFAATAILLASLGLYGTLAYSVSVRRREIGLRLALGAEQSRIVQQFLSQGLRVAAVGALAGIALTLTLGGVLAGMLYGISPADPWTLGGVVVLVLGVTAAASLVPALRASRVEPMRVLREE